MRTIHRGQIDTEIPPRVRAAMDFLHYCPSAETSDFSTDVFDSCHTAIRMSALEVIRLYFTGEMAFGADLPALRTRRDDSEDPEAKSRVPTPK